MTASTASPPRIHDIRADSVAFTKPHVLIVKGRTADTLFIDAVALIASFSDLDSDAAETDGNSKAANREASRQSQARNMIDSAKFRSVKAIIFKA